MVQVFLLAGSLPAESWTGTEETIRDHHG
jgi:hypothetical protein